MLQCECDKITTLHWYIIYLLLSPLRPLVAAARTKKLIQSYSELYVCAEFG